ncbi:hypothetical protein MycrhDRAFT_4242 [Mycolicibacterium rhodesiae JS60]|nr:hypothetical protein MycrhDRAFT_4242 [Mycolicibacterium rhodesiae JS60]
MKTTTYRPPDNPAAPAAAALDLIVQLPRIVGRNWPSLIARLKEFALALDAAGAFEGLSWHDAKHAAAVMVVDLIEVDNPAAFIQARADRALDGSDNMTWDDPVAMSRALTIGARALGL